MAKSVLRLARAGIAPRFERPDLAALARGLDIDRRARAEAADNIPAANASEPSQLEREIAAKAGAGAAQVRAEAARILAQAQAQARLATPAPLDLDRVVSGVELDIAAIEARRFEPLIRARLEERRRWRELRRFKIDHNLERDALYAETPLQPAAALAMLVAAESAANALLLQQASSAGYIGGFLIAVVMSVVTVAAGALFAGMLGIRLMRRQGLPFRCIGGLIFIAALIFAGLWALALARYRDAAVADEKAAGLFGTADGPVLGFGSLESLALVVLGFAVFVLAALKGAGGRGGFTDAYWGYKPRHAAHKTAEENYEDEQEDFREALNGLVEDGQEAIDKAAASAAAQAARARAACDQGLAAAALAQAAGQDWAQAYNELIRRARAENLAIRTAPAPLAWSAPAASDAAIDQTALAILQTLRDKSDAVRVQDAAAAAAARRVLADKLYAAQERRAQFAAAAEAEADRRLAEEVAAMRDPNRDRLT